MSVWVLNTLSNTSAASIYGSARLFQFLLFQHDLRLSLSTLIAWLFSAHSPSADVHMVKLSRCCFLALWPGYSFLPVASFYKYLLASAVVTVATGLFLFIIWMPGSFCLLYIRCWCLDNGINFSSLIQRLYFWFDFPSL